MPRKTIISIAFSLMLILILTLPVTAVEYKYTGTGFRYIGDIFHQKEIEYFGGMGSFSITGFGEASGRHDVHTVRYNYESPSESVYAVDTAADTKVNISLYLRGRTDPDYGRRLAQLEEAALANIEARRERDIAELNAKKAARPTMTGEEFAAEMFKIQNMYDAMIADIIDSYSSAKKNVRILTSHSFDNLTNIDARVRVGVDMDPGEEGYIRQTIASTNISGNYLSISSHFENTGGTTKRDIEISGFINERMRVDGYARVSEKSTVRDGRAKTGWWDTRP